MRGIVVSGALLLVVAGLLGACAEERDPINRVQPYALPKTFFIGEDFLSSSDDPEFWTQNSVIDVGYGAAQDGLFTSSYAQPMSRVKWQITENYLIARAAYERIESSDGKGVATGFETQDGIIAAIFPIDKHFDIVNAYNPTTGEKLNVVEENSTDRPWYEREYIRVDWSKNEATDSYDFDTLSLIGVYGGIDYEPLSFYVEDPNDESAPIFDIENGYFDVTTKALATPGVIDLKHLGWGIESFPACFLDADFFGGTAPAGMCSPVELTLRHSFRRVVDNDFQPVDYDGWRFKAFGGFAWTQRSGYDPYYGIVDGLHYRFLSRFQIWERAHYYDDPENMEGPVACYTADTFTPGEDPNKDADGDGTADVCRRVTDILGIGGSQCDIFSQKCTLPFRARKPIQMAWYYTNNSDQRFFEASEIATHQWDVALRTAINAAKYAECTITGGSKDNCAAEYPIYFGQQRDNDDVIALAMEVDDCRHGLTHRDDCNQDEACCTALADEVGTKRDVSPGVKEIAMMPETIVLCHSPVQANDPEICAPADKRLPQDVTAEMCDVARASGDKDLLDTCLAALNVRRGDLRYHLVNVIKEPATPSPWGIMTSAVDPLNGQTIQSCVNVWAFVNDFWSQRLVDYMRFAAGELSAEDVTEAEYIKDWSQSAKAASRGGMAYGMSRTEFDKRVEGFLGRNVEEIEAADKAATSEKVNTPSELPTGEVDTIASGSAPAENVLDKEYNEMKQTIPGLTKNQFDFMKQLRREFIDMRADGEKSSTTMPIYESRLAALRGTSVEASLMNAQMQQLYGVDDTYMSSGVMDMVSPLRGGNIFVRGEMERLKQSALAERGMCEMEMAATPVSINGLSKILQEKFGNFDKNSSTAQQIDRAKKMAAYIGRRAHMAVIVHEMGHAMAHRHNFVGSSDAFNYRPQYWQLRTKNGKIRPNTNTKITSMIDPTGESTVGPRYFDPVTQNEEDNLIWMWGASSVMDYAGEATQDFLGLGAWDFAALRMFYGDTAPVYPLDYASLKQNGQLKNRAQCAAVKMDGFGGILGWQYEYPLNTTIHYTLLPWAFDLIDEDRCSDVNPADFVPARYNSTRDGEWNPVIDGEIVSIDGGNNYSRCRDVQVDYTPWRKLRPATSSEVPGTYIGGSNPDRSAGAMVDNLGRVRVPYGFATDRWADIGNAAVYRHDNGADTYEIFGFLMTQQELFHIFDNYRRGRMNFSVSGASGRINERYNGKIRDGAKGLALQKNFFRDRALEWNWAADSIWETAVTEWWPDSILASTMAFDHFVRTAQRPEVGEHVQSNGVWKSKEDSAYSNSTAVKVTIPNGAFGTDGAFGSFSPGGKAVENRLSEMYGEYDSEYTVNAGSYYDKVWSSMMMTESVDNFISDSRGDFVDSRYRATSLADLLPDGYRRWLAHNLTGDEFMKGARIAMNSGIDPSKDEDGYPAGGIGNTMWWTNPPQACFPVNGTTICSAYGVDPNSTVEDVPNWDLNDLPLLTAPVETQLGWETQKYLITWTYVFLPENEQQWWLDQLWMWDLDWIGGGDLENTLEFHNPAGRSFAAKRFGREEVFGREVEKGVAARVIEYANELLQKAYETIPVDEDGDSVTDWYDVVRNTEGDPIILFDGMVDANGGVIANCNASDNSGCTCEMNHSCIALENYQAVLVWMSYFARNVQLGTSDWDSMIGIYG